MLIKKISKSKIQRTQYWCYVPNNQQNPGSVSKFYVKNVVIIDGIPTVKSKFKFNQLPDQDGTYSFTLTIDVDNFSPLERLDLSLHEHENTNDGSYLFNLSDAITGSPLTYHKVFAGHGMKPGRIYDGYIQAAYVVKGDHRGHPIDFSVTAPGVSQP